MTDHSNGALTFVAGLENDIMADWRRRSQNAIYRTDPEAWVADILGQRWHAKQREIVHDGFMKNRRNATKSSNGSGKSLMVGQLITWGACVHEPGELLQITSAPTLRQIEEVTFSYIASNYGIAKAAGLAVPGYLTESVKWIYREGHQDKAKTLVLGQRPSDRDIIGSFQGIRAVADKDTKTWVWIDEGGAVHDDLYDAAEAVTTGAGDNRINVIGNPDRINNRFHHIFTDRVKYADWMPFTISAFDLPTFTGEVVYAEDAERQRRMLSSGMIDKEWVDQKRRAWGEDSARYKSKVLGEFPDADDHSFFSQTAINMAEETEIDPDLAEEVIGGADIAGFGEDDTVLSMNRGGHIRIGGKWSKAATTETSNRLHRDVKEKDIAILVIDATGIGQGVFEVLKARADRLYTVIGMRGAERSPDPTRWSNMRACWYDLFREAMLAGEVDLDYTQEWNGEEVGKQLRDELMVVQFDYTNRGAIKIESKKEMRERGVKSPDILDAVVYSWFRARVLLDDPLAAHKPGDTLTTNPWDDDEEMAMLQAGLGLPMG